MVTVVTGGVNLDWSRLQPRWLSVARMEAGHA